MHRAQLTILYHYKRERFFDSIDRFITALTLVTASAATAAIYSAEKKSAIELWMALAAAIGSCIQVAYTPGAKASIHRQIASDMKRLASRFEEAGEEWSDAQCDKFTAELLNLEASEPAPLGALVVQCENEVAIASGRFEDIRELKPLQAFFMHWWNFDVTMLKPISSDRAAALRARLPSTDQGQP